MVKDEFEQRTDVFNVTESRLFERKMQRMLIPTQQPVMPGWIFGLNATPRFRPLRGVVVAQEVHPEYGKMIEIEHGDDMISRCAHASRTLVKKGVLVKRGQKIAEFGSTGRSTGAHLHFEVLVQGVFQESKKFLPGTARASCTWQEFSRVAHTRRRQSVKRLASRSGTRVKLGQLDSVFRHLTFVALFPLPVSS